MSGYFIPVFLASIAGGLHCAAMCGPFSAFVAGVGSDRRPAPAALVAYHAGRLVTYLALGAAAGVVGRGLDVAGNAAGIGRASALTAGFVLVLVGASALVGRSGLVKLRRRAPSRLASLFGRVLAWLERFPPMARGLLVGLATTLLPCGWLYAFVATAAGTGDVLSGLAVMLLFWSGTVPWLVGAALGLRGLVARLGPRVRTLSAALVALSGLVLIGLRIDVPRFFVGNDVEAASNAAPPACPLHQR